MCARINHSMYTAVIMKRESRGMRCGVRGGCFFSLSLHPRLHNGDGGETNGGVSQVGGSRNCCRGMADLLKKGGLHCADCLARKSWNRAGRRIKVDVSTGADPDFASSSSPRKTAVFLIFLPSVRRHSGFRAPCVGSSVFFFLTFCM